MTKEGFFCMEKKLQRWRIVALLASISLLLAGCGEPFLSTLTPAGEVAKMQYDLMIISTLIMVLVIVVVTIIFLYVVFKFRRKGNDLKIPKQVEGSHKLEILWTVIPIILLVILAVPTVSYTFKLADTKPMEQKVEEGEVRDALVVNVRANLYWWDFEYEDYGVVTGQELVVPTDERIYFNLAATDVKHSFWIPAAGGKIDTNVETKNPTQFFLEFDSKKADEASNYFYGKCAELCGPSHALMDFKVKTVSREEFNDWIATMQRATEKPQVEGTLAKQGEEIFAGNCMGCHAVTTNDARPADQRLAPNLANFGERTKVAGILDYNKENIKAWLEDTQEFKPGNTMPSYGEQFTDEELDAVTEYLMQLKVQQ